VNERIIELRKQCITEVKDQHGNWINYHFDENKFAELIVIGLIIILMRISLPS